MKWIKASERLPKSIPGKPIQIYYKYKSGNGEYWKGAANIINQFLNFAKLAPTDEIEWLDESLPSGGKSAEEIKQIAEQRLSNAEWLDDKQKADTTFGFRIGYKAAMEEYASQYAHQQPVNDGWVRVEDALPDYRLVVDVYKSHHNVVEPAARLSTDITGEKWSCEYGHYITHWRLRPEPPKQTV